MHPAKTDLYKQNAHTDAEYMFANQGLDTEAPKDWYISEHSRHDINPKKNIGLNVCIWHQLSSLTKNTFFLVYLLLSPCTFFTFNTPLPQILVFFWFKITYIYLLILQPLCSGFPSLTPFSFKYAGSDIFAPLLLFKGLQLWLFITSLRYAYFKLSLYKWLSDMPSFVAPTPLGIVSCELCNDSEP